MRTSLNKALFAGVALLLASCGKEAVEPEKEEPENKPETITKEAVIGTYVITKVEASASGKRSDITNDWFGSYAGECSKDDVTQFKPDNSFVVMDGTIACDETTDDTGTWDVINATALRWDADTATIEAFNSATLRIVSPVYSSAQNKIIFTYTRK